MTVGHPGVLAVRAVNQYRRRDVLTYLALRYYLASAAARADHWAREVSTELVLTRSTAPYFRSLHFKETDARGNPTYRDLCIPGANEALAEAALLDQCASLPAAFSNPSCVFSYELSQRDDPVGVFQPYLPGLQKRHQAITGACEACPDGVVRYADIRRFYPSITKDAALSAWGKRCTIGNLDTRYRRLGEQLIHDHDCARQGGEQGILTGPMLSHLIGNLVLRDLDDCSRDLPTPYFRYVDDIVLVGESARVRRSLDMLRGRLGDLGFELHDDASPKSIEDSTGEWLKGREDFRESRWKGLIGDLKRFLVFHPNEREQLRSIFLSEGLRIPVRDYSAAIHEVTYLERLRQLGRRWIRRKIRAVTIESLLAGALGLRRAYQEEFLRLMDGAAKIQGLQRKRRVPKLRYRAARLVYLATEQQLATLSAEAATLPDLRFHAEVMSAVASGNIDSLLTLGSNAAQAAAQPLRAAHRSAITSLTKAGEAEKQGLAVFALNGVPVEGIDPKLGQDHVLVRFAAGGADAAMMRSGDAFIRELACLHGLSERPRHPEMLETAFAEDEELAMDTVDQFQQSAS